MKLTKTTIDKIKPPTDKQQAFYRDDNLKGFAVRITKTGIKSFIVEKRIKRKVTRITLGRYGELTAEQARKQAQTILGSIAAGNDPIADKQASKLQAITLNDVFAAYLSTRKNLKPKTIYDYERIMRNSFNDWGQKLLLSITKDKIAKRHTQLGERHGNAYANLSMRVLRALFNFAIGKYEDSAGRALITENPVKRLSHTRAWYRIERRQTYIKPHELSSWHKGVTSISNTTLRDYLLLTIFTGLRRQEAAQLKWSNIDFKAKSMTISNTKNNKTHNLPLSDYLFDLLKKRKKDSTSDYIFSGNGKNGYIIEPRRQITKIIKSSGVSFTMHDLRRTFITIAESLDISVYALKTLLNHTMSNDVTAGYVRIDVERLRKPMQKITDFLLKATKISNIDNVIKLDIAQEN